METETIDSGIIDGPSWGVLLSLRSLEEISHGGLLLDALRLPLRATSYKGSANKAQLFKRNAGRTNTLSTTFESLQKPQPGTFRNVRALPM